MQPLAVLSRQGARGCESLRLQCKPPTCRHWEPLLLLLGLTLRCWRGTDDVGTTLRQVYCCCYRIACLLPYYTLVLSVLDY